MAIYSPTIKKAPFLQDARTVSLLNKAISWGQHRGVQIWTRYKHNFRIGDRLWINNGYYKNVDTDFSYGRSTLKDWTIGYEVLYVDSISSSLVIKTDYIGSLLWDVSSLENKVFISCAPFLKGDISNGNIKTILVGESFNDIRDNDFTQSQSINYPTTFPVISTSIIDSGICINGTLTNIIWNGDKTTDIEYVLYNDDVLPRKMNGIVESLFIYSVLLQGKFSGTWINGLWERGVFDYGTWYDGWFRGGYWNSGLWYDGIMEALNNRLEIRTIDWRDGIAKNIIWRGGTWKTGDWKGNDLIVVNKIESISTDYRVYLNHIPFLNNFLVGDIVIFSGSLLVDTILDINNRPFRVITISDSYLDLTSMDGISSLDVVPYIGKDEIIKITNSCWTSGTWNGGFWRGGIKGDTSFWIDNISLTGPNHNFSLYKTALNPYGTTPELNYVFVPNDFVINENVYSWNLTESNKWNLLSGPTGIVPLKDFTLLLSGPTNISYINELSPSLVDFSIWNDGVWDSGLWIGGLWQNGLWSSGIWLDGIWNNGLWSSGERRSGFWNNGKWKNGLWNNSISLTGLTTVAYHTRDVNIYGITYQNRSFAGSSVFNNGIWENGNWKNGLWVDGTWFNGNWYQGSQFKMKWMDGNFYTSGPVSYTDYQPGFMLYDTINNWTSRIENISLITGIVNYNIKNNTEHIPFDSNLLLYPTQQISAKIASGIEWFNGDFNIQLQGQTSTTKESGIWIKGDFKNGDWYNGIFSPSEDIQVWDKDTKNPNGKRITKTYPGRYLDYTIGNRHNIFQNGNWKDGEFMNGLIMSGQFSGGIFHKMYAVSSQGDISIDGIEINNDSKYFVDKMAWNPINLSGPSGPTWNVIPSGLENISTGIVYNTGLTSRFYQYDILSMPDLFTKWSVPIDGITSVNEDTLSLNINLISNETTIRRDSFIEIRGLIKRNELGTVPNGFHMVQNIYNNFGSTNIATTGRINIHISGSYYSDDLLKGLDWSKAYLVKSDSIIIKDEIIDSLSFNNSNPIGSDGNEINTSIKKDNLYWITSKGLKPSVETNPIVLWKKNKVLLGDIVDIVGPNYSIGTNLLFNNLNIGDTYIIEFNLIENNLTAYIWNLFDGINNYYFSYIQDFPYVYTFEFIAQTQDIYLYTSNAVVLNLGEIVFYHLEPEYREQVFLDAENGLYKNTLISSTKTIRLNNSDKILSTFLKNDKIGKGDFFVNTSNIRMSHIENVISDGIDTEDTILSNGTHNSIKIERTLVKGIDDFGYKLSDSTILTNTIYGQTSPSNIALTGIDIKSNTIELDFSNITGPLGFRPYQLGDLIMTRGIYSDYTDILGGGYSKSHLIIGISGTKASIVRPSALTGITSSYISLTGSSVDVYRAYDTSVENYSYSWASSIDFSNVLLSGKGKNGIFNKGQIFAEGYSMVLFSEQERNYSSGPTGYIGLGDTTINGNKYNLRLDGITFESGYLYSVEYADSSLSMLKQYGITGGNVFEFNNKISDNTIDILLNQGPHLVYVNYLKRLDNVSTINSKRENNPLWNTSIKESDYSIQTKISGNLYNSLVYKANMINGSLISITGITGQMNSTWLNGLWSYGGLSGIVQVETDTSYPDPNNLLSWKSGIWKDGIWYGGLWDRGLWKGGRWDSGLWESFDSSINNIYDINQSSWEKGIFRSVILTSDGKYSFNNNYSIWSGGKWSGYSGFKNEDGTYNNQADPFRDYSALMHDEILKSTWNGPFKEYEIDSMRSAVLPGTSSLWIGGKWLRGDFDGGIFFNGIWWSSDRGISGPYPVSDTFGLPPLDITSTSRIFDISGPYEKSKFHKGAFLNSVWEGGIFGDINTGPTGSVDERGLYWRSKEYESLFGLYIPQDRNLTISGNIGWDYSNPMTSTRATWTVNDSPFVIELQQTEDSTTKIFEWRQYIPNILATKTLFGKEIFVPTNNSPLYQPNGLLQDIPMSSLWKRGHFINGISMWSVFDSLLHITTPDLSQKQNWDYSTIEAHSVEVLNHSIEDNYSAQPSVANAGLWSNCYWNAGLLYFNKATLYSSIWVNGIWSDIDAIADPEPDSPIYYFNPYEDFSLTGPATITGGYGPPNGISSTSPFTWEQAVTGISGEYGVYIKYISDPSWKSTNVNFHKNFYSSIWYGGLWDGGRFSLSVWNSYAPGLNGWTNEIFNVTPFKTPYTGLDYRNWTYQVASTDYRDRWNLNLINRYEVQEGAWPLGYLDTFNAKLPDNAQQIELKGIVDISPKDPVNLNLLSYFDTQSGVSDPSLDNKYRIFRRDLLTSVDFDTWVKSSNFDGTGPIDILIKDTSTITFSEFAGLSNSFALAYVAKIGKVAGPDDINPLVVSYTDSNGFIDYNVNLSGTFPAGYLPTTASGTFWQGIIDSAYINGRVYATLYKNEFDTQLKLIGSTGAHLSAIKKMEEIYDTTAFDYNTFDDRLQDRLRLAGEVDNYVSRWYRGEFKGSIWNGGIWETGILEHISINGDGFAKDWFGRTINVGTNYTLPSAWFRGIWKSGRFSTRDVSDKGIIIQNSSDKRSYKKSLFLSVPLVDTDTDFTSNYDMRTSHGLSETLIKSAIEFPINKYPSSYKTIVNSDYYLNDTTNFASWFTRTKKINDNWYYDEIKKWFGALDIWDINNKHQIDFHYFSEFNGVFISGVFLDLFKRNTFVMDYRGIPQRTPLLSSYSEFGNRPSLALSRSESVRRGLIYGNQPYQWNWGYDKNTSSDLFYNIGYKNEGTLNDLKTGPFYYPFFISSRTLFRLGPDQINETTTNQNFTKSDYITPLPVVSFPGQTATYQGAFPLIGDWYLTPGIPCYSFPDWSTGPTIDGIYYSEGNNMKNTIRISSSDASLYQDATSIVSGTMGVESLLNNQYLGTRKYYYDYFLYSLEENSDSRQDINYLSNTFDLDGLSSPIEWTNDFKHPVYLPNGHIIGGTQPPYDLSIDYKYGGLTGRPEEDLLSPWRLWPAWFYGTNKWTIHQEDIHNFKTWNIGSKFLGESKQKLKYIFEWIPLTGGTNPSYPGAGWENFQQNDFEMQNNDGYSQDYYYNNILDREYNYGQRWIGFDDNIPPTEMHQTVLHYNFGDGYSWIWPKVLFTDIFDPRLFYDQIDGINVDQDYYQFVGSPPQVRYIDKPLITRFDYTQKGISNLILKKL